MLKSSTTTKSRPSSGRLAPLHPGRILREDLRDAGITLNALALALRVPATRIGMITSGRRAISADTATRLARFFGTSAQYWLNLQNRYDLDLIDARRVSREVLPRESVFTRVHPC